MKIKLSPETNIVIDLDAIYLAQKEIQARASKNYSNMHSICRNLTDLPFGHFKGKSYSFWARAKQSEGLKEMHSRDSVFGYLEKIAFYVDVNPGISLTFIEIAQIFIDKEIKEKTRLAENFDQLRERIAEIPMENKTEKQLEDNDRLFDKFTVQMEIALNRIQFLKSDFLPCLLNHIQWLDEESNFNPKKVKV